MSLWATDASSSILRFRRAQKSSQQCQLYRLPAHSTKTVRANEFGSITCSTWVCGGDNSNPSPRSSAKIGSSSILETYTFAPCSSATTPSATSFDRPNRLKGREEGIIRWVDLLEKFRSVQERARRAQRLGGNLDDGPTLGVGDLRITDSLDMPAAKPMGRAPPVPQKDAPAPTAPAAKKSGLGRQFGRLGGAMPGRGKRAQQQNQ